MELEVNPDEEVWRSVRPREVNSVSPIQLSTNAFTDRSCKPSVDRAVIRRDPELSKLGESDGVIPLLVNDIRLLDPIRLGQPGTLEHENAHLVTVIENPIVNDPVLPDNLSHALIVTKPDIGTKSTLFRKLKLRLARLAEQSDWLIEPKT